MTIASALFAGLVGAGLALGAFLVFHWANHKYVESDSEAAAGRTKDAAHKPA